MLNSITKIFSILIIIVAVASNIGCSNSAAKYSTTRINTIDDTSNDKPGKNIVKLNKSSVKQLLNKQYQEWKGTPYKLGGNSKNGIDCSGFVHITFKQQLHTKVPRTTKQLSKTGTNIKRNQLAVGDLVFFVTGLTKRHVGIYLGNGEFLHASTSRGVMISNLRSQYWSDHYWKSRRILVL